VKCFHSPITSHYLQDTADVYAYATEAKGHVEVSKDPLYDSIPCYAYKMSSTFTRIMLGDLAVDRWKIIFPLTFNGSDVEIKEHFKVHLTKHGSVSKLRIESMSPHPSTHIEAEAVKDG
jgi:hypothetical protein